MRDSVTRERTSGVSQPYKSGREWVKDRLGGNVTGHLEGRGRGPCARPEPHSAIEGRPLSGDGTLEPLSDCLGSETGCTIRFEGSTCEHESSLIVAEVRKRKKIPSKELSDAFGPTPLSMEERISSKCLQLVIGTEAYGNQPVMEEVQREAEGRRVELVVLPTSRAIDVLHENPDPRAFSLYHPTEQPHLAESAVAPSTSFLGASFWILTPPLKYAPSSMEMRWVAMSPVTTADCFRSTRSLA